MRKISSVDSQTRPIGLRSWRFTTSTTTIAILWFVAITILVGRLLVMSCADLGVMNDLSHPSSSSSSLSSSSSSPYHSALAPFAPRLRQDVYSDINTHDNNSNTTEATLDRQALEALDTFFKDYVPASHGWIDLSILYLGHHHHDSINNNNNNINNVTWIMTRIDHDVDRLRTLARTMMRQRPLLCGVPTVKDGRGKFMGALEQTDNPPYCFWQDDSVSQKALEGFSFERSLWRFVLTQFQRLVDRRGTAVAAQLGFLDLGVNVGDWASPILAALPASVPYFAVEGSPPTAALAAANMLTSLRRVLSTTSSLTSSISQSTPSTFTKLNRAYLFPFPLLSWQLYQNAVTRGGVCFAEQAQNIGGQGVVATTTNTTLDCPPHLAAGAGYLPQALQAMAKEFQSPWLMSSSSNPWHAHPWPSIYIAKLDIQGFEFKALSSALEWLQQKPPCYLLLEVQPAHWEHHPQMWGIWELLLDAGYDALWRSHDLFKSPLQQNNEFPPGKPYWTGDDATTTLYQAWYEDTKDRKFWAYKDYILGFQDEDACLERLLER